MNLRLLVLSECNRTCKLCCNKNFDLLGLPVCQSYKGYESVILTGGEPLLQPELIKQVVSDVRKESTAPVYVYTAKTDNIQNLLGVLAVVDGITLTLHSKKDVPLFAAFNEARKQANLDKKSLRLKAFAGVSLQDLDTTDWSVNAGIRWMKDCPLPQNEVFMRVDGVTGVTTI